MVKCILSMCKALGSSLSTTSSSTTNKIKKVRKKRNEGRKRRRKGRKLCYINDVFHKHGKEE